MKISLICDTHAGVRSDNPRVQENSTKFFTEVYFPKLKELGIKHSVHLGDVMDRRKYVNILTANQNRLHYMQPHTGLGINLDIILGNHDVYYRETNQVSSVQELYHGYEEAGWLRIFEDPSTVTLDGLPVLYLPWMNASNGDKSLDHIRKTNASVCMGHLELVGFEMHPGHECKEGLPAELFDKFSDVFSGHFHHRSRKGNIQYLGAHSEFTWSDYNDERGFHIFDTETRELEFFPNPYNLHEKLFWNTNSHGMTPSQIEQVVESCAGKFVKVIVQDNSRPDLFENFISILEEVDPIDVDTVEDHLNADKVIESLGDLSEIEDTLKIFDEIIVDPPVDETRLKKLLSELYSEAMEIE